MHAETCMNWACDVKRELQVFSLGLWEFWNKQEFFNVPLFLTEYKSRIWDIHIKNDILLFFFENFNKCFYTNTLLTMTLGKMQPYLRKPIQKNIKIHISRIRLSLHCLNVEIGRYQNKNRQDMLCESCNTQKIDDEFHFAIHCPKFLYISFN